MTLINLKLISDRNYYFKYIFDIISNLQKKLSRKLDQNKYIILESYLIQFIKVQNSVI